MGKNEQHEDLEVTNSFTDASGTTYTGQVGGSSDAALGVTKVIQPSTWDELKTEIEGTNTTGWDRIKIPWGHEMSDPGPSSIIDLDPTDPNGNDRKLILDAPGTFLEATSTSRNNDPLFEVSKNAGEGANIYLTFGEVTGGATTSGTSSFLRGFNVSGIHVNFESIRRMWRVFDLRNVDEAGTSQNDRYCERWILNGHAAVATETVVNFYREPSLGGSSMQQCYMDFKMNTFDDGVARTHIAMDEGDSLSFPRSWFRSKMFVRDANETGITWNSSGGGVWFINFDSASGATGINVTGTANDPAHMTMEPGGMDDADIMVGGSINHWRVQNATTSHYYGDEPSYPLGNNGSRIYENASGEVVINSAANGTTTF